MPSPAERRIKGWSRAKKEALIRGDFEAIRQAGIARGPIDASSFETPLRGSSG
jgi:hypothetical protein